MGSLKDRNGVDITKQKILRRGGKNTQNCIKMVLMTGITHLEPDILECDVKGTLGSINMNKV